MTKSTAHTPKKREKKPPEPYWNELVETWFRFCRLFMKCDPSFDGSAPRDLKQIIFQLRTRCEKAGHTWDENTSTQRLWAFLKEAFEVDWLKNHWNLSTINRQKDIVFYRVEHKRFNALIGSQEEIIKYREKNK